MNKKISLGVAVAIVIAFVTATFAITMSVSQRIYNKLISNLQQRIASYSLMDEADSVVRENYYGTVSETARNSALIAGYIDALDDGSSYYLNANAYSAYLASIKGEVNGIGINATYDFSSGYIMVLSVLDGSPADSAGIKKDDLVVIRKQNTAEDGEIVVAMINGETTLKRIFRRNGKVILHPENKEMKDIVVKDCEIQGVLVSCIKIYD